VRIPGAAAAQQAKQQQQRKQQPQQRPAGQGAGAKEGEGGEAGEAAPPPVDERTWLQKNWLIVMAGGMMVSEAAAAEDTMLWL
jgi:hypothetical protein